MNFTTDHAFGKLSRRHFLSQVVVGAAGAALGPRAGWAQAPERKPNIILIMADDCSAKEFSCYGNLDIKTPRLDDLARTGAQFATCWCTPICSPTRAEIMTGRYGFRTSWFHNNLKTTQPLCRENQTIGCVLKAAGYATAIAGKWQLPGTQKEHGFDEYFMWLGGHNLWRKLRPGFSGPVEQEGHSLPGRPARYWHPAIVHNDQLLDTGPDDYGPDMFVDYINGFIERHRSQPFFVYYPLCLPHASWDFDRGKSGYLPSPVLDAAGQRTRQRSTPTLKANVEYIDHLVGRIVDNLDRLGLRRNTVLLFTCDNGTSGYGKARVEQERGPRVPMIANAPGLVQPLRRCEELIDFSDVLPTLAELAGTALPPDYLLDGRSFAPLLLGETYEGREWIFSYYAVHRLLRTKRWLLDGNGRLYDCGNQRNEQGYKDVTDSTDPQVAAVRKHFEQILAGLPAPPEDMRERWSLHKQKSRQKRKKK